MVLGLISAILEGLGTLLERSWSDLGAILGRLGSLLGCSWELLGRSWRLLGCSWKVLGRSWQRLGTKGSDFENSHFTIGKPLLLALGELLEAALRAPRALLEALGTLLDAVESNLGITMVS